MGTDVIGVICHDSACKGHKNGCWRKAAGVQILALPPISCVALRRLLKLSVFQLYSVKCGYLTGQGLG